jgi:hypothetical protein
LVDVRPIAGKLVPTSAAVDDLINCRREKLMAGMLW